MIVRRLSGFLFCVPLAFAMGCSSGEESPLETTSEAPPEVLGQVSDAIVGGVRAPSYVEAALIDMSQSGRVVSACSGALIAPRVVLTAGHCVGGFDGFTVRLPYASNQTATAEGAAVLDYVNDSDFVNPNQHDVGLIFLSKALTLPVFPKLAEAAVADGTRLVNVGRIQNDVLSRTDLFVGAEVTAASGARFGFPYSYVTSEVIQSGDSGGPVFVVGQSPHLIAAVNSGGGQGTQVLARVDLVLSWIRQQVQAHGGFASTAPTPTPTPTPACASREAEPNDSYQSPTAVSASEVCGALTPGDEDWFSFRVASANRAYRVATTSANVEVRLWKQTSTGYRQVTNTSPTEVSGTASSAGTYVGVIYSPTDARVDWRLSVTR